MSVLQEQAVRMINGLSDDKVSFLIEIIQQLMPQKVYIDNEQALSDNEKIQAFTRLNDAREEIKQYLPEDFDPDKELVEARLKRYDSIN